jgi:GT2 family glycosyltransferase
VELSIVLVAYNRWDLTRGCLASLQPLLGDDTEVIVVDNASTDYTPHELPQAFPWVRYLPQKSNLGFGAGNNMGARHASGSCLLFLNNDTVLEERHSVARMLESLRSGPGVGAVGARLVYPNRCLQHAGLGFNEFGIPVHPYRHLAENYAPALRTRPVPAVTGACLLMPRQLFLDVGGFDEGFINGYEDVDLCLRLGQRGHAVIYRADTGIIHFESQTPGRSEHEVNNLQLYQSRWSAVVTPDLEQRYTEDGVEPGRFQQLSHLAQMLGPQNYMPSHWALSAQASPWLRTVADDLEREAADLPFLDFHLERGGLHQGLRGIVRPDNRWLRYEVGIVDSRLTALRYRRDDCAEIFLMTPLKKQRVLRRIWRVRGLHAKMVRRLDPPWQLCPLAQTIGVNELGYWKTVAEAAQRDWLFDQFLEEFTSAFGHDRAARLQEALAKRTQRAPASTIAR